VAALLGSQRKRQTAIAAAPPPHATVTTALIAWPPINTAAGTGVARRHSRTPVARRVAIAATRLASQASTIDIARIPKTE